ncbi:MAG TPA: 50S ribosomal protein L11 methyltransferase, partial [Pyrinomonadaceae bacterium]|nr:50S ribosomal protein L11 methyltransferase [Pyrinomonadaceae bacterium]
NQKTWFAVDVFIKPAAVEAVEFGLNEAGASGTEYSTLGKKEIGETVSVVGYSDEKPNLETIESEIKNSLTIYNLPLDSINEIVLREVENHDWLAEWKKHWRPTETAKFIVAPTWSEIETTDKIVLRIEPGMAFGTGTHETTRLCLQAIEENYEPEMSFFDVGTGTGVLAMAAAKLQGENILACDTDIDSVKIAAENAEINGVADKIEFYIGSISSETPQFDFVAANLTADVIVPILPLLVETAVKTLALSGILSEQQDWVTGELNNLQVSNFKIQAQGEWISIVINNA